MQILVVEDNPDLVDNLREYLGAKDYDIDVAADGPTALKAGMRSDYDVIVLDLMLPGMDGLEVCRHLREAGKSTPVLMLTARDTLDDKLEGFGRGADDYMVKPFALQELEVRLQALARRAAGEPVSNRLKIADLEVDTAALRVYRSGREINLPPIQMKILMLLMRQAHRVVTRQEIEREIWGDSPPDSDALRAHMHVLRTAIDKPFEHQLLRTVHGIGYQLVDLDAVPS